MQRLSNSKLTLRAYMKTLDKIKGTSRKKMWCFQTSTFCQIENITNRLHKYPTLRSGRTTNNFKAFWNVIIVRNTQISDSIPEDRDHNREGRLPGLMLSSLLFNFYMKTTSLGEVIPQHRLR